MKPVLIRINKKTVEPSPNLKYDYRICFRFKIKINYNESESLLSCVGNPNVGLGISTDAQFAKWLVDSFGLGKYLVFVWKKGRQSFCTFYFDCEKRGRFKQIRKKKTVEEEDKEKTLREIRRNINKLKTEESTTEKKAIKEDIDEMKEMLGMGDEIIQMDKDLYKGKVRIFKNTNPVYKEHEYENYGESDSDYINKYDSSIW